MDALLDVRDLSVQFAAEEGWLTVVDGVSFEVGVNERIGIVGESGSGKSVTAMSLLGLIPTPPGRIAAGSALFDGQDLLRMRNRELDRIRGNDISIIFQEPSACLNPAFTVGDQIAEVVRRHKRWPRRRAWARAVEMLDRVGIPSAARRANDYPHQFSGGMAQRVLIAMALACEPRLLIADEPTTALDVTVQSRILEVLRELQDESGMSVLLVTHDLGVVADFCERVLVMYAGQLVEEAVAAPLFEMPRHPYTEGLLRSMPQSEEKGSSRLWAIPGTVPAPWAMPTGCRFNPRCPYTDEHRCVAAPIELRQLDDRRSRCVRVDELDLRGTA